MEKRWGRGEARSRRWRRRGEADIKWLWIPDSWSLVLKRRCTSTLWVDTWNRQKFLRGITERSGGWVRESNRGMVVEWQRSTGMEELPVKSWMLSATGSHLCFFRRGMTSQWSAVNHQTKSTSPQSILTMHHSWSTDSPLLFFFKSPWRFQLARLLFSSTELC